VNDSEDNHHSDQGSNNSPAYNFVSIGEPCVIEVNSHGSNHHDKRHTELAFQRHSKLPYLVINSQKSYATVSVLDGSPAVEA
jgi:hypothetical protein